MSPYFLRSFIRGSRVRYPADFKVGLYSASASRSALEIPWRIAPACPVYPPPCTLTSTLNLSSVLVATSGWRTTTFSVSSPKYSSMSLLFIVILPVPGTRYTLAIDFFSSSCSVIFCVSHCNVLLSIFP